MSNDNITPDGNVVPLGKNVTSLGERRATSTHDASKWSIQDVLRDAAERSVGADAMVIVWRHRHADGSTSTRFAQCGPDVQTALGLLKIAGLQIYDAGRS